MKIICNRCIYDSEEPGISFDENGICNYCRQIDEMEEKFGTGTEKREKEVNRIINLLKEEGMWNGFDVRLIREVTDSVNIPVIAHGGAGKLNHITDAVKIGHASAVALGSLVVYQQKGMGVLVNFPDQHELALALEQ